MEIPIHPRGASQPLAPPEIYVHDSIPTDRYRMTSRSSSYNSSSSASAAIPMSIPNSREAVPPPPLPPPRHLADIAAGGHNGPDIAWQWGNLHNEGGWERSAPSVAPGSSLRGSFASMRNADERSVSRRTSSTSTVKSISGVECREHSYPRIDEGYASLSGTSIGSNKSKYQESSSSRTGFQSSVHDSYQSNAHAFDKSLLQKLDARRASDSKSPPRPFSKSSFSSSLNDGSPTSRIAALEHRYPTQLKPLSLPLLTGKPNLVESPLSRWAETPLPSAISPGNPYPRFSGQDFRSPSDTADSDRSPLPYIRRHGSGSGSVISASDETSSITSRSRDGYYDQRVSPDNDVDFQMEEAGMRRLHIEEYSSRSDAYSPGAATGQKRRASSPPVDDPPSLHTVGSASDLFRRRESASRTSPGPRFHTTSGSISSTTSDRRTNSYSTTFSIGGSSIISISSSAFDHLSPGGLSPVATDGSDSPYTTSLNPSPRGSLSKTNHSRALSDTRPLMSSRKLSDHGGYTKSNNTPKMHGGFICECCPKKPKKFDSQEELHGHAQEKQYECAYCPNRFKNKNEAERHQNSLHLRRHSWSCAALSDYASAFHTSPTRPNEADSCGYCGEDFPRSRISSPTASGHQLPVPTEQDWEVRVAHLQEMHKFGECNHAKKFFRADHFRQHLKHSHAGTSGKWTNMLENACMKDEPLPEPIRGPDVFNSGGVKVGRITEEDEFS